MCMPKVLAFLSIHSVSKAWLVFMPCQLEFSVLVSCHVIKNQEMGFTKAKSLGLALHQILVGNVTYNYYMFGTTTKLSMLFQVLGL